MLNLVVVSIAPANISSLSLFVTIFSNPIVVRVYLSPHPALQHPLHYTKT